MDRFLFTFNMQTILIFLTSFVYSAWVDTLFSGSLDGYLSYDDLSNELLSLSIEFPDLISHGSLGNSTNNLPIYYAKITGNGIPSEEKGGVLITTSQYAGYPSNVNFVMYLLKSLVNLNGMSMIESRILETNTIWIVPVVNVDGYLEMENRYLNDTFQVLNKNLRNTECDLSADNGVNLNRN